MLADGSGTAEQVNRILMAVMSGRTKRSGLAMSQAAGADGPQALAAHAGRV
ncbi:MAG: hypothetical protein IPK19_20675 [Chloroflexi bacterium]|nr:hypothetical protein [Chloroflexota bacterium]